MRIFELKKIFLTSSKHFTETNFRKHFFELATNHIYINMKYLDDVRHSQYFQFVSCSFMASWPPKYFNFKSHSPTAVLKKHWWKHNEQKKLFSQYGFWTSNNLKYLKIKCFGEGFYNIFIFEGFFSIILLIFARYFRYLKLPTLQWKSFEK